MTNQQITWASQHDWFKQANKDGSVSVIERRTGGDSEELQFSDFRALKEWAGY